MMWNGYEIQTMLRKTIFGRCVVACQCETNQQVVLKITDKDKVAAGMPGRRLVENPQHEIAFYKHLHGIEHNDEELGAKHIMRCIEIHEDNRVYVAVLEYCSQGDMFDLMTKEQCDPNAMKLGKHVKTLKPMFEQMCCGLAWLHARGIVHRDISLENVFVTSDGTCKLGDFGQVLVLSRGDNQMCTNMCHGKTKFRSPEQVAGHGYNMYASDVFAMGVCLFILLSGVPLFNEASDRDLGWRHVRQGQLSVLIKGWNLTHVIDEVTLDLLNRMLCPEKNRVTIEQVLAHPCFEQDCDEMTEDMSRLELDDDGLPGKIDSVIL
jgi:serine/threonine protein kinase